MPRKTNYGKGANWTVNQPMSRRPSAIRGLLWMLLLSLLLFWLPVLGPLIAGFVGGQKSGSLGSALLAVFLPGIIMALLFFFFGSALTGLPLLGALIGAMGFVYYAANVLLLLVGAIVGGLMT